jgi:arsenate reductase
MPRLARRLLAEFIGTGMLVAVVIGSGIMAARLSPGQLGLELFENTLATVAALAVIITVLAPMSGAHLNPVVAAQTAGAVGGAVLANLMFALPAVSASRTARSAPHLWIGEVVATAGLVLVVFALARSGRGALAPVAVAGWT